MQEKDEATGKTVIRKLGVKPVQRDDLEYEFDITLKLNDDHSAEIIKNTVKFLGDKEETIPMITEEFGKLLGDYLNKGLDPKVYEEGIKQDYIKKIKALGEKYPSLLEYFKAKHPNTKLNNLDTPQLKTLLNEFERML